MQKRNAVLDLAFACSVLLLSAAHAENLSENQARLGEVIGDVGLLSSGALEWIVPREGLPLEPGDQIRTGEDGRVELVVGEGALWILEPETMLAADSLLADSGRFHLSSGTLLGSVRARDHRDIPQRWDINTPVAVVAIRGTEFALSFSRTDGARLGVFEGAVDMQPAETADGPQSTMRVMSGEEVLAGRGKPLKRFVKHSEHMSRLGPGRERLRRRHRQIQSVWSPFTPSVRKGLRTKVVAPPPKRLIRPRPAPRQRRGVERQNSR